MSRTRRHRSRSSQCRKYFSSKPPRRSNISRVSNISAPETASHSTSSAGISPPTSTVSPDRPSSVLSERCSSGSRRREAGSGRPSASHTTAPIKPAFGCAACTASNRLRSSSPIRQSGLRISSERPAACFAPRFTAGPKPMLRWLQISLSRSSCSCARAIAGGTPSREALSTRISSSGSRQASTRRTQSRRSGPLSAATTITLSVGGAGE